MKYVEAVDIRCGSLAEVTVGVGHVRSTPKSGRQMSQTACLLRAMCGRLRVGKKNLHFADWSEQPCVRPVCAVLMTAGHNALRGSGPGQKHAFDDAVALVGCPDRQIDRHCIKCCSSSQPLRHTGHPVRSRFHAARAAGSLYRSFLAIMAQAILASLLASAMAAILVGRRVNNPVSQGRCSVPWILA